MDSFTSHRLHSWLCKSPEIGRVTIKSFLLLSQHSEINLLSQGSIFAVSTNKCQHPQRKIMLQHTETEECDQWMQTFHGFGFCKGFRLKWDLPPAPLGSGDGEKEMWVLPVVTGAECTEDLLCSTKAPSPRNMSICETLQSDGLWNEVHHFHRRSFHRKKRAIFLSLFYSSFLIISFFISRQVKMREQEHLIKMPELNIFQGQGSAVIFAEDSLLSAAFSNDIILPLRTPRDWTASSFLNFLLHFLPLWPYPTRRYLVTPPTGLLI